MSSKDFILHYDFKEGRYALWYQGNFVMLDNSLNPTDEDYRKFILLPAMARLKEIHRMEKADERNI